MVDAKTLLKAVEDDIHKHGAQSDYPAQVAMLLEKIKTERFRAELAEENARQQRKRAEQVGPNFEAQKQELQAVIEGLSTLKRPTRVELFTDSVYVGKGLTEYLPKWKANGWRRKEGNQWKPVANEELWRKLDELVRTHHITYTRVAGHSGHPENDRCDQLAVEAGRKFR